MTVQNRTCDEKDYWNARYGAGQTSGYGSYGEQLKNKLAWISRSLDRPITSILEVGCGDFNFGMQLTRMFPSVRYLGTDISKVVVRRNRQAFGDSLTFFEEVDKDNAVLANIQTLNPDLLVCVDVLYHIYDQATFDKLFADLKQVWTKYLVLTAYEYDGINQNHIAVRRFDPAFFGEPILREIVEEDGSLYFYVFKK